MKSKFLAFILWFFFGSLSMHRFYVGKIGSGIIYLLTGQLFGIGWIIDLFLIGGMIDNYNNKYEINNLKKSLNVDNEDLYQVSLKWGLIYAGISCLSVVASYAFGLGSNKVAGIIIGLLSLVINVLVLVMANKDYRITYLNGYIGYWQCFVNSILVIAISTVIVSLVTFLLYQVIDPQAFESMINEQLLLVSQNDALPAQYKESQVDALVAMTPLKQSLFQLLGGVIWGLILSLIVSAFTRKKNNTFEGAIKEIE